MKTPLIVFLDDKGATVVLVAICMGIFLGFVALAVDVGYMMVARAELQRTADAAALAGARQLGVLYEGMDYEAQQIYDASADEDLIKTAATSVASQNKAAGSNVVIDPDDVTIGRWDQTNSPPFTNETLVADAVQVVARRDSSALSTGPISTFFARVLGINTINVSATATAALTSLSSVEEGGLPVPVGISQFFFSNPEYCHDNITFYPSNSPESCAGWHIYDRTEYNNANDYALRTTITQLDEGTYQSSELGVGTQFQFTGGTMSTQTFAAMQTLYDHNKDVNGEWEVTVPVYESDDCGNPHGTITIVGFARVIITGVLSSPDHTVLGRVECNYVETGRGGGGNFGTKGSIPGLVQ